MEGDSLKLNFEIALDRIATLTKHNNELLDSMEKLEHELAELKSDTKDCIITQYESPSERLHNVSKEADAAMKRFTNKIRKEVNKNAKSKQSQGQPVWERNS